MSNLQKRQSVIQEKRKKTPWRDFVMELASRCPVNFYKFDGKISRYPNTPRTGELVSASDFVDAGYGTMPCLNILDYSTFSENIEELRSKILKPRIWTFGNVENCDFSDTIGYGSKNCYLTICAGEDIENILYSFFVITKCTNVINSLYVTDGCNNIYTGIGITQSYNVFFSRYVYNSSDIRFSSNMQGCRDCFFCDNLQNQSYCIRNKQYTKEDYLVEKQKLLSHKSSFDVWRSEVNKESVNIGSENCTGMCVLRSEDIENGVFVNQVRNGRNLIIYGNGADVSNCYDCLCSAMDSDQAYGNMGVSPGAFMYCSMNSGYLDHVYYSVYCQKCSYCFGCYGLIGKSFYIYNKKYSEEERYELIDRIFAQMEDDGSLGSFFPSLMNPFYFNDTAAYLIDPTFTKEEVVSKGYLRRDEPIKVDIPAGVQTINVKDLGQYEGWKQLLSSGVEPRNQNYGRNEGSRNNENLDSSSLRSSEGQQWTIDDEILKKVIIDEEGNAYRIIPMELEFLRKYELPLPRKHWLDRMKENFRIN